MTTTVVAVVTVVAATSEATPGKDRAARAGHHRAPHCGRFREVRALARHHRSEQRGYPSDADLRVCGPRGQQRRAGVARLVALAKAE